MNAENSHLLLPEKEIKEVFRVGMVLKGMGGIFDVTIGSILLFTNSIMSFVTELINNELLDDPNDFIAIHAKHLFEMTPETQLFVALYLMLHGLAKLVLITGLWFEKAWAFPASMAVLSLFVSYQILKIFQTHSVFLVALTIFDLIFLWLIYHEYRRALARAAASAA